MEERLDPKYFSTTPENSWELFKWVFTEPIKLNIFSNNLSEKESFIWFFRIYLWVFILAFLIFLIFNSLMILFDDLYMITMPTPELLHFCGKDIFLDFFVNLNTFTEKISFLINLSRYDFLKISLLGLIFGATFSLLIGFRTGFIINSIFLYIASSTAIYSLNQSFFTLVIQILIIFFLTYFIENAIYGRIYHFIYSLFININLENNQYLKYSYDFPLIFDMEKELANDSFIRPKIASAFTSFLLEFRPYQRELAFYLLNIRNASNLYHNTLSHDDIYIPKGYEDSQPSKKFVNTLIHLKNELGIYNTQHNIQFKRNSLKKVILLLKELKEQIRRESRSWNVYYFRAININLDESEARIKNISLEAKSLEPITPNIYNIGNPLSPNYQNQLFKGRKDVVDRLSNIIYTSTQMPLLLIQGQRRVGKTSLINYLEQLLGSGFKIVKLDMQSATNKRFNSLVQNINQELNEMLGIDASIETSDDMLQSWINFEEYLTKHTKALNYKIIIAFDEYESFHKHIVKKHGEDILENMRSFMQSQNQVIFLFSGMLRISDLTSPNWDEYFPHAQRLKVDYLSKEESLELIIHPVEDFNLVYTNAVANEVYELTMGHPQLLQTICSIIVTIANQTNKKEVSAKVVAKAKEEVFEINEMPMTIFWREFCGKSEREVMEQILSNKEVLKETKEQKRAVARLVDYGFIRADMKIRVPLFEKWLVERRDLIEL